jgi:hypothetical protein
MNIPEKRYDSDGWFCQYDDDRGEQIGSAQERAVRRRRAAEDDVVAAAGTGVATVEHEFFRAETAQVRIVIQRRRRGDRFVP